MPEGLSPAEVDKERRAGRIRGPMHGIPVLLKANIATHDRMRTTAGSLALVDSRVPADARIVAPLRAAGAVILGKANLSEWANFRDLALGRPGHQGPVRDGELHSADTIARRRVSHRRAF